MFKLTTKQELAQEMLAGQAIHCMLFGGSRSGKTFLAVMAIVIRAMRAPKSRHAILRFRFNTCKTKVAMDTFLVVMDKAFPGVRYHMNKEDWFAKLKNGSEIWFGGLDDKLRTEKILGAEFSTIFLNECSEIPWNARNIAMTRLAQKADTDTGPLPLRMYYDENPPDKGHWTYKLFIQHTDPDTKRALLDSSMYVSVQMNPDDNVENIAPEYISLLKSQSSRYQRRFLYGEFRDTTANSYFDESDLDKWRVTDGVLPEMVRIVIAVDPSGAKDENSEGDAIGIVVAGLGIDGNAYVLEDLTLTAGPAVWGKVATDAYDRHEADCIIGENNYGGAMVHHVIETARVNTTYRDVTATRGKTVRAEPISSLVSQGRVRLVGYFPELEEELAAFTISGFVGERSPNRGDACIFALTALFPGILSGKKKEYTPPAPVYHEGSGMDTAWMQS